MDKSQDKEEDLEMLRVRALIATRQSSVSDQASIQYLPQALVDYARSLAKATAMESREMLLNQLPASEIDTYRRSNC